MYLAGLREGLEIGDKSISERFKVDTNIVETVPIINEYCSDYRNKNLWVLTLLHVIQMETNGDSKESVDLELRRLRSLFKEYNGEIK
jgi:hypothetical protein